MKLILVVISLIGLGYATLTAEINCTEDEDVVKRVEEVIAELSSAFENYTAIMESEEKNCSEKLTAATEIAVKKPMVYQSLFAVVNAIHDQYESPLRSTEMVCAENEFIMEDTKAMIAKLQEAFEEHKLIMAGAQTCREKLEAVKADSDVNRSLKAVYYAVSDLYNSNNVDEEVDVPVDYLDREVYNKFEEVLKDISLFTKVKAIP